MPTLDEHYRLRIFASTEVKVELNPTVWPICPLLSEDIGRTTDYYLEKTLLPVRPYVDVVQPNVCLSAIIWHNNVVALGRVIM